jgi:hypothetical protein
MREIIVTKWVIKERIFKIGNIQTRKIFRTLPGANNGRHGCRELKSHTEEKIWRIISQPRKKARANVAAFNKALPATPAGRKAALSIKARLIQLFTFWPQ